MTILLRESIISIFYDAQKESRESVQSDQGYNLSSSRIKSQARSDYNNGSAQLDQLRKDTGQAVSELLHGLSDNVIQTLRSKTIDNRGKIEYLNQLAKNDKSATLALKAMQEYSHALNSCQKEKEKEKQSKKREVRDELSLRDSLINEMLPLFKKKLDIKEGEEDLSKRGASYYFSRAFQFLMLTGVAGFTVSAVVFALPAVTFAFSPIVLGAIGGFTLTCLLGASVASGNEHAAQHDRRSMKFIEAEQKAEALKMAGQLVEKTLESRGTTIDMNNNDANAATQLESTAITAAVQQQSQQGV